MSEENIKVSNYYLIGLLKKRTTTIGYRIMQLKDKKYVDLRPDAVKNMLLKYPDAMANIGLDNGEIVGTQGTLERYAVIRETRVDNRQLVIIKKVELENGDLAGYIVTDYRLQAFKFETPENIIAACMNPLRLRLANGKIIENQNGTKFISPIQGNYAVITISQDKYNSLVKQVKPVENREIKKPVENREIDVEVKNQNKIKELSVNTNNIKEGQQVMENKIKEKEAQTKEAQANDVKRVTIDDFEYVLGYELDANGKWVKSGLNGYGIKFIGEDSYLLKPCAQVDGIKVVSIANAFKNVRHAQIDLRDFDIEDILHCDGAFVGSKESWTFLAKDVHLDSDRFKRIFKGSDTTIVSECGQCLEDIAKTFGLKTVRFNKTSVDSWFEDAVKARSSGKGMAVVLCGASA